MKKELREMPTTFKDKVKSFMFQETSGIKLNLLTLRMSDPEVKKDFTAHKIEGFNRTQLFVCAQVFVTLNLLINIVNVFVQDRPVAGSLMMAGITFLMLQILWPICYFRCQSLSRYIFPVWFIATLVLYNVTSRVDDVDSVFYIDKHLNDCFLGFTVIYIMTMAFFSYCEFMTALLVYTPLYLASSYLTQLAQSETILEVQKYVPAEYQVIVQDNIAINMNRAVLIAVTLLMGKYLQQLDVIQLMIKSRSINKQG